MPTRYPLLGQVPSQAATASTLSITTASTGDIVIPIPVGSNRIYQITVFLNGYGELPSGDTGIAGPIYYQVARSSTGTLIGLTDGLNGTSAAAVIPSEVSLDPLSLSTNDATLTINNTSSTTVAIQYDVTLREFAPGFDVGPAGS